MKSICRLCSLEDNTHNLHDVFSTKVRGSKDLLVDILYWTFSVEIVATDKYPKVVCTDCKVLIEYVMEIKNAFQRNQSNILKKYLADPLVPVIETVKRDEIPIEIMSDINEEEIVAKNSSEAVKVKVTDLENMCPSVVIKPFETSEEYMWYKPVGFGRFIKRKYRHFRFDDDLLEDICDFLGTEDKVKNNEKGSKVNGFIEDQPETMSQSQEVHKSSPDNTNRAASPKVWLEPVEYLLDRENYKQISNSCYTKNSRVKNYRVLAWNHNATDTMYKLSNTRKLWVCEYCNKSFLCQTSLKFHYKLKHGRNTPEGKCRKREKPSDRTKKSSVSDSFSEEDTQVDARRRLSSSKSRSTFDSPSSQMCSNDSIDSEDGTDNTNSQISYVWDRKKLGIYSATTFYNIKSNKANGLVSKWVDLDETVRKLESRLDGMVQS